MVKTYMQILISAIEFMARNSTRLLAWIRAAGY
jgi:hypothetical protein